MSDDPDRYAPVFNLRVRCETIVVWDRAEPDYLPLEAGWRWTSTALFTCGAPSHWQASSEHILVERRNGLAVM